MNVIDWQVDPTTRDVIKEIYIEIQDPGIKQWLEAAEVNSFRVFGNMTPRTPGFIDETNRMVAGYFAWGTNKAGGLTLPSWGEVHHVNWQRTYIIAPDHCYWFRLWLRYGVKVDVFPKLETPWEATPGTVTDPLTGKELWHFSPPP